MKRDKLLYFYFFRNAFVTKDLDIFQPAYDVREFHRRVSGAASTAVYLFLQFFFLLANIRNTKILVCQFAGHHSVLPVFFGKLFRKPVLLIPGGSDCCSFPSIQYGHFRKKALSKSSSYSYRNAAHIAPVHESLIEAPYTYTNDDFPVQGIRAFCKNVHTPFTTICNGYDSNRFYDQNLERKANSFLTVGVTLDSGTQIRRKGIDLFLELAVLFPDFQFTMIGAENPEQMKIPANLSIIPAVPNEELPALMNRHQFYVQLSMYEGFPNALCEAMLCGCIPIVSDVTSMPEIVGESGFVLKHRNIGLLAELIREIKNAERKQSLLAHQRIAENWPLEKRKEELLALLEKMIHPEAS